MRGSVIDYIYQWNQGILYTSDNVTLRGWLFTPESTSSKLPCLIMSHGWSALKEMDLDAFANYFTSKLALSCLVYDNRGFGDSDQKDGHPRQEIIPSLQQSDISDAITFAQSLPAPTAAATCCLLALSIEE
jgi:cephalosporin-C deacetylase-like acetyl esterase